MKVTILILALFSVCTFANEIDETLSKARAIKLEEGESKGFVLKDMSKGSIYEKIGLKSNDKITKVNGKKINGLSEMMEAIANVKSITVVRNGKEETLNNNFQN
jgi:S1-C subfamily serine protease